jgi:pSer/pThr/pTyr-binding forkhead associated (FHA) protein
MDDRTPPEERGLPLQGPHWQRSAARPSSPGRIAGLRLVLQPSGWSIDLDKPEVVLGRHISADVRLPLPDVSRLHCRLVFAEGLWHLFDLNSLNGVHLNGEQVRHAILHHGDQMRIGGFTFAVELPSSERTLPLSSGNVLHRANDQFDAPQPDSQKRQAS